MLLAIVGGWPCIRWVLPPAAVLIALCVGAFLLTAEAAEVMTGDGDDRSDTSFDTTVFDLLHRLVTPPLPALTAPAGVAAVGLGTALTIAAAPVVVVVGAIALGLLCWWAAAPRWPR